MVFQCCIVHLVRNSLRYVPSKDYKAFTASLKKLVWCAACQSQLESFQQQWSKYPGAIDVWIRNFKHVEQLFDYGSAIRKIMYSTNTMESIHASFRKVIKKGRRLPAGKRLNSKSFIYASRNCTQNGQGDISKTGHSS